jgi:hypothetical protein
MKQILFAIFFCYCLSIAVSNAQHTIQLDETVHTTWDMSTGARNANPFHKFTFSVDGDPTMRKTGNTGWRIRPYLSGCPEAIVELDKFKTKRIIATTAGFAAIGYFVVYAAVDLNKAGDEPPEPGSGGPNMGALFGPVIALGLVDIIFAASSNKHMYNAVALYNKDNASGQTRSQPKLIFGNSRTSLGLRVAIQF